MAWAMERTIFAAVHPSTAAARKTLQPDRLDACHRSGFAGIPRLAFNLWSWHRWPTSPGTKPA